MERFVLIPVLALSLLGGASLPEAWNWSWGQDAFYEEKFDQAAETFAKAITGQAGAVQSKISYNEAAARYRMQDWQAAEKAYGRSHQLDAANWRALYGQGNAQVQQGYDGQQVTDRAKLEAAVTSYEAALEIEPNDADTIHNLEFVKKLLEEDQKQQQQQPDKNDQKQDQQQQQNQQNQNQDQQSDSSDEGDNEQKQSESEDGDKEKESESQSGDQQDNKDQQGDQQQQQQNQGGEQEQQMQNRPDLRYSQEVLDRLAQQEAAIQYNRAMARDRAEGDPLQNLLNQLMDPSGSLLGEAEKRRKRAADGVDW
ncbi:MAG: hypothetical protein GEEBNDBF_00007 [bacterium]|nr:hypothetical protein [bacterium]